MKSIQIIWCTEDIIWQAEIMGINWDVIGTHIDMYMDKLNDK